MRMGRKAIVIKLTDVTHGRAEGVTINMDGSWSSPPGGWLSVQAGIWEETPGDGTFLRSRSERNPSVAELKALHPRISGVAKCGRATYPSIAGNGQWEVTAVSDL